MGKSKKNPQPMEATSKKGKKEYSGEHKHKFFNRTSHDLAWNNNISVPEWYMFYGYVPEGMSELEQIKYDVGNFANKLAKRYGVPFKYWESNQRFYDNADRCSHDQSALYFLRCWLDYIVVWEGYAIWNFVHKEQLKLEEGRNALRNADRVADETLKEFEGMFV